jgi:heme-degrading monooxygenase HmoA
MVIRVVRMHFTEEGLKKFLPVFNLHKTSIRNFPGCTHLELLKDAHDPLVFTTLSYWNRASDLDAYRHSDLFKVVWSTVKPFFSKKTEAFTFETFMTVE